MPINDFSGNTFVAFIDISGFKELMKNRNKAEEAMDWFYQNGYKCINTINDSQRHKSRMAGLFVSDCGIVFVGSQNQRRSQDYTEDLRLILLLIREINKKMLERNLMLTTSIAYGEFKFHRRYEGEYTIKAPIYGDAYVKAFFDNKNGKPKIQPGQCRILKENLPRRITNYFGQANKDDLFRLIKERTGDSNHYYFYWMRGCPEEIEEFEQLYRNAYSLKYAGMREALKGKVYEHRFR